jgi:hypothetical protein
MSAFLSNFELSQFDPMNLSLFLVKYSVFIFILVLFLLFGFEKRRLRSIAIILVSGFLFSIIGLVIAFGVDAVIHSEKGVMALVIGFWASVVLWAIVARQVFRIHWITLPFVALLPILYLGLWWDIQFRIHALKKPPENSAIVTTLQDLS